MANRELARPLVYGTVVGALLMVGGCGSDEDGAEDEMVEGSEYDSGSDSDCKVLVGGHCLTGDIEDECGLDTGYDGDIMCLKAPAPEDGMQIHLGPSEYTPEGMKEYLLAPGVEGTACMYTTTPNETRKMYYESIVHMRPVSHHLTPMLIPNDDVPPGYDGGWATCGDGFTSGVIGGLPGAQNVRTVIPTNGVYAPEYTEVGWSLLAKQAVRIEVHFINTTDHDLLRESWTNIYYKPQQEVKRLISGIQAMGSVGLITPAGAHVVNQNSVTITGDMKVMNMFGHYHANATRFSIWRVRDGQRELLYEDFNWFDPTTFAFDSVTVNPVPDASIFRSGARSGILEFQNNDVMYWECEVENNTDVDLRYRNEAITGQMCNVFGQGLGAARFGDGLNGAGYSRGVAIPIDQYVRVD